MVSQAACGASVRAGPPGQGLEQSALTPKAVVTLHSELGQMFSAGRAAGVSEPCKFGERISPWDNYCALAVGFAGIFSCFPSIHIRLVVFSWA